MPSSVYSDSCRPWLALLAARTVRHRWGWSEHDNKGTRALRVVKAVKRAACESYENFSLNASANDGPGSFDVRLPATGVWSEHAMHQRCNDRMNCACPDDKGCGKGLLMRRLASGPQAPITGANVAPWGIWRSCMQSVTGADY